MPLVMPLIKVILRTACIKNGKLKIIKIRSGCQYVGYLSLQLKLKMGRTKPSTGPWVGHSCFKRTWRGLKDKPPITHDIIRRKEDATGVSRRFQVQPFLRQRHIAALE